VVLELGSAAAAAAAPWLELDLREGEGTSSPWVVAELACSIRAGDDLWTGTGTIFGRGRSRRERRGPGPEKKMAATAGSAAAAGTKSGSLAAQGQRRLEPGGGTSICWTWANFRPEPLKN